MIGWTIVKIILCIAALRLIINSYRLWRMIHLKKEYTTWVTSDEKSYTFVQKKSEVLSLWKTAGVHDYTVPFIEPAGFGHLIQGKLTCFGQFPSSNTRLIETTMRSFHEAIGEYKRRCKNAINPIDWILVIVDFPKRALDALNIHPNKGLTNFLRFIWWLFGSLFTIFFAFYPNELKLIFERFIQI